MDGNSCLDIQIYDLVQAFDSLWIEDCMNDIFESVPKSEQDDKLALIFEANKNNLVAVNTPVGQTERVNIERIVTQGGTFGPIECANTIDKIGKTCYEQGKHLYSYKQLVKVMPLSMVDDLLAISTCGQESLALNTYMNTKIELKKLKFHTPNANGKTKCHKIHVGPKNKLCPQLQVHGTPMVEVDQDTYLGDIVSGDGKNSKNVKQRVGKGVGIIADILNILEKVTLGEYYFSTALLLREALFINGILTNAEVWYGLTKKEIQELEDLDCQLLRKILKTKFSVPAESLYLELGCLNIETILKARRINYLHYLTTRKETEMVYKFFLVQWKYPSRNDWTEQVKIDLEDFGLKPDLDYIKTKSKEGFKTIVKNKAKEYAFMKFVTKKENHSKLRELFYSELKTQEYLKNKNLSANQAQTVFSYRTRMSAYSENFRGTNGHSPCPLCLGHMDSQAASFQCPEIAQNVQMFTQYGNKYLKLMKSNAIFGLTSCKLRA